jgi:hypothetical protein
MFDAVCERQERPNTHTHGQIQIQVTYTRTHTDRFRFRSHTHAGRAEHNTTNRHTHNKNNNNNKQQTTNKTHIEAKQHHGQKYTPKRRQRNQHWATWYAPAETRTGEHTTYLCTDSEAAHQFQEKSTQRGDLLTQPQPHIGSHLVVATATGVQFTGRFADQLLETTFVGRVDILISRLGLEAAGLPFLTNLIIQEQSTRTHRIPYIVHKTMPHRKQ